MIKRFEEFILENTDSTIEIIEDCFLEFCDEYDLDVSVEKGHLASDNYITTQHTLISHLTLGIILEMVGIVLIHKISYLNKLKIY